MAAARAVADWLASAQAQMLCGKLDAARTTLAQALAEHPAAGDLQRAQAGVFAKLGQSARAEAALRALLGSDPKDAASAFALANLLKTQARMTTAAACIRDCMALPHNMGNASLAIAAIEFLDGGNRELDAAEIADAALHANPLDARLHAYAGMLDLQLGRFESAREHYLFALLHDPRAWEWHVPLGLSATQRYTDRAHPDFALFTTGLQRSDLSEPARTELHFAMGKAHDDIGDYPQASVYFRTGNAAAQRMTTWSRKAWRRGIDARMSTPPSAPVPAEPREFAPIFIVGMPRSGTTLLASLLARHPQTCNRGELPWVAELATHPALAGAPGHIELQNAARSYRAKALQDDLGADVRIIDKQPLNFRYIDLILAMFPAAKIVHCTRSPRDTVLSLWMQRFREDVQGYAYAFEDIALVMRDCERLLQRWHESYPDAIRSVRYEDLVAAPDATIVELAHWLGLPPAASAVAATDALTSIATASLWQARQPINTHSIGRWRHYLEHLPELGRFTE